MIQGSASRVGAQQIEIVADGVAGYDVAEVLPNVEPDLLARLVDGRLNPDGSLAVPYDPLLVRAPGGPILLDAGAGEEVAAEWGAPIGHTEASLAAAGLAPDDIALVLITHAHVDHVAGLTVLRDGVRTPHFPRARHVMSAAEWRYWIEDDAAMAAHRYLASLARLHLPALMEAGVLELIDGAAEVAPGVRIIPAPGHTPGHVAIEISSGEGELLALGDAILDEAQVAHPDWTTGFDTDADQTVATRRSLLDRAASRRSLVHGYHLAALGRIERSGDAYRLLDA